MTAAATIAVTLVCWAPVGLVVVPVCRHIRLANYCRGTLAGVPVEISPGPGGNRFALGGTPICRVTVGDYRGTRHDGELEITPHRTRGYGEDPSWSPGDVALTCSASWLDSDVLHWLGATIPIGEKRSPNRINDPSYAIKAPLELEITA